ncbi:S8 family serine peptidase [Actinoplanes regularis]|uniref:S8 family serine peptidase n=1 Tax=Actinoplanes regularis TaxID=52697 RepID=UPI0024A35046|nr:S8 family serine peptidase [Actinoplanes regularis]GLW32371.1 type VII secretion-associated serine protease [Actinoplanes regularis]
MLPVARTRDEAHPRMGRPGPGRAAAVLAVALAGIMAPAGLTPARAADCVSAGQVSGGVAWPRTMLAADSVGQFARGGGVRVAVLSTGVQADNPQFTDQVLAGNDAVDNKGTADTDCRGTGTQVAGVIAAKPANDSPVTGLAGSAGILPVRVVPDDPGVRETFAQPDVLARAVDLAMAKGADVIVVASPAYDDSNRLRTAIAAAIAADVPVIAATGDLGSAQDGNPTPFPAAYQDVIAVGAIDQNGKIFEKSGHGTYVDLVAPGVAVPTLQADGLVEADGTAIAAGYVGATAALIRSRVGRMPVADVTRLLTASASPTVTGDAFGAGVVNPYSAITGKVSGARGRALPALSAAPAAGADTERRRRVAAFAGATLAAVAVVAVLMVTAAIRRSRRQHWRPALAPPLPLYDEPVEPGPPVMLLDDPAEPAR